MFVVIAVALVTVLYVLQPWVVWRYRHIPGPPWLPLLGNIPDLIKHGSPKLVPEWRKRYGSIFKMWMGRSPVVVVTDMEAGRLVMSKLLNHGPMPSLARGEQQELERSSLLVAEDELWRTMRNAWAPAFSPSSFVGYAGLMDKCALQLCQLLRTRAASGEEIDIWQALGRMTLQVVGTTAYGVDLKMMEEDGEGEGREAEGEVAQQVAAGRTLVGAMMTIFSSSRLATSSAWMRVASMLPELRVLVTSLAYAFPDRAFSNLIRARQVMISTCRELVAAWQLQHGGQEAQGQAHVSRRLRSRLAQGIEPGSFLGLMLEAESKTSGKRLSELQVLAQPYTFILAGYETTAVALAYTIYCLARNPAAEARLLQEVDGFGRDTPVSMASLDQLPYTEAAFKEALRMYPPATLTTRVSRDQQLQLGPCTIPPHSILFVSLLAIMNDEEAWPRAAEYLPERFLPTAEAAGLAPSSASAYVPFGGGPRMCVGYKFALAEAKVALVRLYQRYTFRLTPGQVPLAVINGITMAPRHGVRVTVHARE